MNLKISILYNLVFKNSYFYVRHARFFSIKEYYRNRNQLMMNFSQVNRTSLMTSLFTDRTNLSESNKPEDHFNPSKNKLNINRQSLSRGEVRNEPMVPPNNNLRTSLGGSSTNFCNQNTAMKSKKQEDQKCFRSAQRQIENIYQKFDREYTRLSQVVPITNPGVAEIRKKCQSAYLKTSRIESTNPPKKVPQENAVHIKEIPVRDQISHIMKRMTNAQEELNRVKESFQNQRKGWEGKQMRIRNLQTQFIEFRNQTHDFKVLSFKNIDECEKSNQSNKKKLSEIRDKIDLIFAKQEFGNKYLDLEQKLLDLSTNLKTQLQNSNTHLNSKLLESEQKLRDEINRNYEKFMDKIKEGKNENGSISKAIASLQLKFRDSGLQSLKKSTRMCLHPIGINSKQTVSVRDSSIFPSSLFNKKQEPQKQFLLKQTLYYIDSEGYLLDDHFYYLLNSHNEQVKLSNHELEILKEFHLLGPTCMKRGLQ